MRIDSGRLLRQSALAASVAAALVLSTACGSAGNSSSNAVPVNTEPQQTATETTTLPPITLTAPSSDSTSTTTTNALANADDQTYTTALQPATAPEIITNAPDEARPPAEIKGDSGSSKIPQGMSMNSSFYLDRLFVAGDSICHGFNVFGFVPEEHCLTQASVSMWNLDYFTFDVPSKGAYGLSLVDAIAAAQPELLYMSLGMNDVNMNDPNGFAEKYVTTARKIIEKVPDINIIIAGITPIDANVTSFTTNDKIREFNSCLKTAIEAEDSRRIYYFDAYSVIADPNTLSMRSGGTSGDGIHLSTECYTDFLNSLYSFLDKTSIMAQIKETESRS